MSGMGSWGPHSIFCLLVCLLVCLFLEIENVHECRLWGEWGLEGEEERNSFLKNSYLFILKKEQGAWGEGQRESPS